MNRFIIYIIVLITNLAFIGCDPMEDRLDIGGAINAEQLDITATPLVIDGKNTNKVVLDNKSPVLSSWDFGVGTSAKKTDTVLLVVTGQNEITFTGRNPDGTEISKTLSVNVDELYFEVPLEWSYLTGGTEKEWTWDDTQPAVWGNGGYMTNSAPAWWTLKIADIDDQAANEGAGAKMTFSLKGAKFTKEKSDGSTETGKFTFDMTKKITLDDGTVWAKGKLTLSGATVLCGKSPNEDGAPVYVYDILLLNDGSMVLSYPEPGAGSGGTGWFWMFKASN
ncbi:hypothetical protein [Olivibacter domesticus]|uniref:PKD domain-containing protein n=1 Tax=Olivibacter domesticus TaxID=407022 RepID=A0A1H7JJT7_OLID1|nr:hypothetical protein [Olivibacter domesticus]SEK74853.1 hypothetical protein SAMN05661044_01042 [Olivibacter domesticus]